MEQHRVIPFYQTYSMPPHQAPYLPPYTMQGYLPLYMAQERDIKEDLQYLQEMFPETARRYAAKIASVVDRMDYKGSMIYDEYPDRLRLQRLAHEIVKMIEKEEAEAAAAENGINTQNPTTEGGTSGMPDAQNGTVGMGMGNTANMPSAAMDHRYREELVYILLLYEIVKRRHGAGMDLAKFYGVGDI